MRSGLAHWGAHLVGNTLSHYRITAAIGKGGMGEVYRATDTKLGREVALKFLPEAFALDAERMARFQREAQVLASLNHPNIAAIYGLEEANGQRSLVMELVDGPTLAERLSAASSAITGHSRASGDPLAASGKAAMRTSPLQLEEALHIAEQITEALEYAHERGVIHRDLKPANIKITPEGTAKVLDFGLAKATESSTPSGDPSNSPTLTAQATQAGMIMGTAAYMAPEQARGHTVDRRADIWSFGVVLYEMLSGQRAFQGETTSDVLASVLKFDPEWNALPASTPPSIVRLLHRCLTKDRKQRLQAIGEARIAIQEAQAGEAESGQEAAAASERPVRQRTRALLAAAALVLAAVAGHFLWRTPAQPSWTGVMLGGPVVSLFPRLSPDGHLLAFIAKDPEDFMQVWVMQPETGNRIMLTHSRERGLVQSIAWSPDSSRIYYDRWYDEPKGIYAVPALGGDEQLVLENAMSPEPLPDGSLLITRLNRENLYQVFRYLPETGQTQAYSVAVGGAFGVRLLAVVPGGREFLVIGTKIGSGADAGNHLYTVDLATGSMRQLPEDYPGEFSGQSVAVAATRDGKDAVIATGKGNTYRVAAVPLDGHGPTRPLLNMIHPIWGLDTGPDGSIYLDQSDRGEELVRFPADGGKVERVAAISNPDELDYFTVLPDGRTVWAERTASRTRLILVEPGKDPSALINSNEETAGPMTPVGSDQLAFMIGAPPRHAIALATVSNGQITRRLSFDQGEVTALATSPDSKTLYCVAGRAVWSVPLSGDEPRRIRTGDGIAVDAATHSLVVEVREPPNSRLVRVPLNNGPEQEIAGTFHLGWFINPGSVRNGKLVAPMGSQTWYWPPGTFDLVTGKSARIPLDYTNDFHYMTWTPDGRIMALTLDWRATIWKFTPQGN
ncbi:MAG TPA: protein kinase [Terriglobia bacterium]|nr:protein kinase [Terriglobia bacterium]